MRLPAFLLPILALLAAAPPPPADPAPAELMRRMLAAVAQVNTCTYRLVKQERVAGKLLREENQVKLQNKPFRVYIKVGSSRVDLQACKLEYSIVSPK